MLRLFASGRKTGLLQQRLQVKDEGRHVVAVPSGAAEATSQDQSLPSLEQRQRTHDRHPIGGLRFGQLGAYFGIGVLPEIGPHRSCITGERSYGHDLPVAYELEGADPPGAGLEVGGVELQEPVVVPAVRLDPQERFKPFEDRDPMREGGPERLSVRDGLGLDPTPRLDAQVALVECDKRPTGDQGDKACEERGGSDPLPKGHRRAQRHAPVRNEHAPGGGRGRGGRYVLQRGHPCQRDMATVTLCPPNPKELLSATFTSTLRRTFGTESRSHAGSGVTWLMVGGASPRVVTRRE